MREGKPNESPLSALICSEVSSFGCLVGNMTYCWLMSGHRMDLQCTRTYMVTVTLRYSWCKLMHYAKGDKYFCSIICTIWGRYYVMTNHALLQCLTVASICGKDFCNQHTESHRKKPFATYFITYIYIFFACSNIFWKCLCVQILQGTMLGIKACLMYTQSVKANIF